MTTKRTRREGRFTKTLWPKPQSPFAFIRDVHSGEDYFTHRNDIVLQAGESLPQAGDFCTFEIGKYNGRDVAVLVRKAVQS